MEWIKKETKKEMNPHVLQPFFPKNIDYAWIFVTNL
jgi:hypothetical protein